MASEYLADALQTSLAVGQARKRAAEVAQQVGMQRAAQEQEMGIRAMQAQAMAEERQARAAGMADQARERDINLRAEVLSNTEDLAPDFNGPPSPDAVNPDAPGALQGIEEAVAQARAKAARNKVLGARNKEELTRSDKLAGDERANRKEERADTKAELDARKTEAMIAKIVGGGASRSAPRPGGGDLTDEQKQLLADALASGKATPAAATGKGSGRLAELLQLGKGMMGAKDKEKTDAQSEILDDLKSMRETAVANPGSVGPLDSRMVNLQRKTTGVAPEIDAMYAKSQGILAKFIKDTSGAAASEGEVRRLKEIVPDPGSPNYVDQIDRFASEVQRSYERVKGGGSAPQQSGGPQIGTPRTFPNGRKAIWDGKGWKPIA